MFESYGFVGEEPALYHGSKSVLDIPRPLNPVVPQMIDESRVGCEAREREYIRIEVCSQCKRQQRFIQNAESSRLR